MILTENDKWAVVKNSFYTFKLLSFKSCDTQLTFICSKSTIETQEKDVKYIQS